MKKYLIIVSFLFSTFFLSAQKFSITNTFGGDADNTGGSDFLRLNKKYDTATGEYKNYYEGSDILMSDRFQVDLESKKLDSRMRIEYAANDKSGESANVRFRGFMRYKPVENLGVLKSLGLAAGNSFFTKYTVSSGYLFASDDYPKYARMLKNGIGLTTDFAFGKDVFLQFDTGFDADAAWDNSDELNYNLGVDLHSSAGVSGGFTFQNVSSGNNKLAVFAGYEKTNLAGINAGFQYNNTDTDFIPLETKYSLSLSGYYFVDAINLKTSADYIMGFTNEYIGKNGSEIYVTKVRKTKGIPMYLKFALNYQVSEEIEAFADFIVKEAWYEDNNRQISVYPGVKYRLPEDYGTLQAGIRLTFDKNQDNGLSSIAVPVSWKWKLGSKKKKSTELELPVLQDLQE